MGYEYHERIDPDVPGWDVDIANHIKRYRYVSQFIYSKRVLDAGCGVGYGSKLLSQAGAREVIGVDLSEGVLRLANAQFSRPGVRFVRDDCESLTQVRGPFDVVVALESLEHFQNPRNFLVRVRGLLDSGGMFVCSTPNVRFTAPPINGKPANPYHIHEYTPEELKLLLKEYFCDVALSGQYFTAAYIQSALLWSNPVVRFGRLLQRLRHGKKVSPYDEIRLTEDDFVISEANIERAPVLLAVCRYPRGL